MNKLHRYSIFWGLTMALVIAIMAAFIWLPLVEICCPVNIQFSGDLEQFNKLLLKKKMIQLKYNTYLDFLFIPAYSFLFYFSLKIFGATLQFKIKKGILLLCFIPGLFDVIENISFLQLLETNSSTTSFSVYYWFVRLKWSFIIIFILMVFTIVFYYTTLLGKIIFDMILSLKKTKDSTD